MAQALIQVKSLGIEALEIDQKHIIGREKELKQELNDAELSVSAICVACDLGRNTVMNAQTERLLEAAKLIGAKKMLIIPGLFDKQDTTQDKEQQIVNMIHSINDLADKSTSYGVSLVIEDFDNALAPFSTIQGIVRFLDNCPMLKVCFDTGNFRYMDESEIIAFEILKYKITHMHLKDRAYFTKENLPAQIASDGQPLYPSPVGMGRIKLAEIMTRLGKINYTGDLVIEHFCAQQMLDYLIQSISWVQRHCKNDLSA